MKCNSFAVVCSIAALVLTVVEKTAAVPIPTGANLGKELAPFVQQAEKTVEKAGASTVNYVKPTVNDLYHDDSYYQHLQAVEGQGRKSSIRNRR